MAPRSSELCRREGRGRARRLLFVLGDQLDAKMPALTELDRSDDVILMTEVREEAEHVPSHRQRTTLAQGDDNRLAGPLGLGAGRARGRR